MSDFEEPLEAFTDEERALLASAAGDRARSGSREATLALLGVGGATVLGAAPVAAGASSSIAPAAKGVAAWAIFKWCSVVAVGAGVAAGGVYAVERSTHSPSDAADAGARAVRARPAPVRTAAPVPVVEQPVASATAITDAKSAPRPSAASPSEPDLHQEIAVIDQARTALSSGDPKRALVVLQGYSRDYPRGTLGPEATLLKVQAWVALGDHARASSVGHTFLLAHPKSPLAARVRTLIGEESHSGN